jgi:hypothetical protein
MAEAPHEHEHEDEHDRDDGDVEERHSSPKESRPLGPAFASPEAHLDDLSYDLSQFLAREPGELVRCRRVSGDHYRCNWWGPRNKTAYDGPAVEGLAVTTHRVIRSQMLRATRTTCGLSINADARQ